MEVRCLSVRVAYDPLGDEKYLIPGEGGVSAFMDVKYGAHQKRELVSWDGFRAGYGQVVRRRKMK